MEDENASEDVQMSSEGATLGSEPALAEGVLDLQYVFEALAHPRRRYLIYTLLEKDAWSLTELSEKIAAWEYDVHADAVTETDRDNVYVSLWHAHVPRLEDDDIVEFDSEDETIEKGPNAEQVLALLEHAGASLDSAHEEHARHENDD
jgi:predicted transcriptional regulator